MSANLATLNENQRKAVEAVDGVIQLCSVAGSGKTRVLTARIAHMINDLGINPKNIMVVTFTKKAAEEMEERLCQILPKETVANLIMGTFHSIGYRILKHEYTLLNHPMMDFNLLQGAPVKWLVKEILKDLNIRTTKTYNENVFVAEINKLKQKLYAPETYIATLLGGNRSEHERNVHKVYEEYEKRKTEKKQIDFNDMLYRTYYLLASNETILKKYQERIQYILVDEAQDNNDAQYEIMKVLAEPQNNIFVVGDDDQSIFRFRGATPEKFINFKEDFPNVQMINLEENYRSLPFILETANRIIKHNTIRVQKELKPFQKTLDPVNEKAVYLNFKDEDMEAEWIAKTILEFNEEGKDFSDMVVLYRTNAQARALEDQMIANGVPFVVFGSTSFYERAEVKDIIAYIKLALNPKDNVSFKRIINKPSRYLGNAFIGMLENSAKKNKRSLLEELQVGCYTGRQGVNVHNFLKDMDLIESTINSHKNMDKMTVADTIMAVRSITKYDEWLKGEDENEEDNVKVDNLDSLEKAAHKYKTASSFIQYVDAVSQAKHNHNVSNVKLMTTHKSKGLEFPIVFLAGMAEGIFPHYKAIGITNENGIDEGAEEERRLSYVAVTRAKETLIATVPGEYQGRPTSGVSRFLYEGEFEDITPKEEEEKEGE
jgi:DNA helicase-2/ATP-dependent DNA helicase PcrA